MLNYTKETNDGFFCFIANVLVGYFFALKNKKKSIMDRLQLILFVIPMDV